MAFQARAAITRHGEHLFFFMRRVKKKPKRRDRLEVGAVKFKNGKRYKVFERGDGRRVAMPCGGRKGGVLPQRLLHRFLHYPEGVPKEVLEGVFAFRRAGFHQVLWSFSPRAFKAPAGTVVKNATALMKRSRFQYLTKKNVAIQHIKDEVSLGALLHTPGWFADCDLRPLKASESWAEKVANCEALTATVPLRGANMVMSPLQADYVDGETRGRFSLGVLFADSGKESAHKFLIDALAKVSQNNDKLAQTGGSTSSDSCGKWYKWMGNTDMVKEAALSAGVAMAPPHTFCPLGNFSRSLPHATRTVVKARYPIPSWSTIHRESLCLNIWTGRWPEKLQQKVLSKAHCL